MTEPLMTESPLVLRGVLESVLDPVFVVDRECRYLAFNAGHAGVMRALYGAEIAVGESLLDSMTIEEDRVVARQNLERVLQGESLVDQAFSGEEALSRRHFDVSHTPLRDAGGLVVGVVVFARDVTAITQTAAELAHCAAIVESSDDAIFSKGLDGTILTWNKGAEHLYGYRADEIVGNPVSVLAPSEIVDEIPELLDRVGRGLNVPTFETVGVRKGGERVPVALTISPVLDDTGVVVAASTIARNITKRLHEREERLALTLDAVNDGGWDWDVPTGAAVFSPRYFELLGYEPNGFAQDYDTWRSLVHADDIERVEEEIARHLESDARFSLEFRMRAKSGDWRWILSRGKAVEWDAGGRPLRMVGTHTDITERKQAEEVLRQSEERFRAVAEASPVGIFAMDLDGNVVYGNERARSVVGVRLGEGLGLRWVDVIHPDDRERVIAHWQQSVEDGIEFKDEFRLTNQQGGVTWTLVQAVPLTGQVGEAAGFMGTITDVTAQKHAEEQQRRFERELQESQKLESLGVLAGGIAHDFNNILMAVLGHADLALEEIPPHSPARGDVMAIAGASRRAADLCRQMLAYSGRGQLVVEQLDLQALVQEMLGLLEATISKKATLELQLGRDLPPVRGDATQLGQLIMNLVMNASEAIGERSGVITVSTEVVDCGERLDKLWGQVPLPAGSYLALEVSDTGCGMEEEIRRRLFEPFFTTKSTGRGLGLSAVLGIVRGHEGVVEVSSELGKGSTFRILLPVPAGDAPCAKRPGVPADDGWRGAGTVLLVDDEEAIRSLGRRMLELLGFRVLCASDGREALASYAAHRDEIVVVVLDLTMPRMGGEETFRELLRVDPDVRVVMSSGYTERDISSRFAGGGPAGFLQKPYSPAQLSERLQAVLRGAPAGP